MSNNVVFFGWSGAKSGRESMSAAHFQDFVQYLGKLQGEGTIQSFEPVLLNPHGGDLNGFFLIRGEPDKLHAMLASEEWNKHQTRALMHLEGSGYVAGVSGERVQERMQLWSSFIPS